MTPNAQAVRLIVCLLSAIIIECEQMGAGCNELHPTAFQGTRGCAKRSAGRTLHFLCAPDAGHAGGFPFHFGLEELVVEGHFHLVAGGVIPAVVEFVGVFLQVEEFAPVAVFVEG